MSKRSDASSPWPHSRQEAEVDDIVRALRMYRVLTRARLRELCGAEHWSDAGFKRALAHAISTGKVRQLDGDLYETTEPAVRGRRSRSIAAVLRQLRRDGAMHSSDTQRSRP